jgi:hypothetical protein
MSNEVPMKSVFISVAAVKGLHIRVVNTLDGELVIHDAVGFDTALLCNTSVVKYEELLTETLEAVA